MKSLKYLLMLVLSVFLVACSSDTGELVTVDAPEGTPQTQEENIETEAKNDYNENTNKAESDNINFNNVNKSNTTIEDPDTKNYKLIKVDGGDTSGHRQSNVVVNIGHGNREYWAYTNEYGQLVRVVAKEIIVQDDKTEDVNADGRYYSKMADVPGVGAKTGYDRGHVIADSLGGVANAYNITPQEATLNRHGDQAYMEKNIRDAGGATNFEAIITYPNNETQIPSKYKYTYTIKGNTVVDEFENKNPDKVNENLGLTKPKSETKTNVKSNNESKSNDNSNDVPQDLNAKNPGNVKVGDINAVDTNGNGRVTIKEAKDAGFKMPIYRGHWLYEYMDDRDGDGTVGE